MFFQFSIGLPRGVLAHTEITENTEFSYIAPLVCASGMHTLGRADTREFTMRASVNSVSSV